MSPEIHPSAAVGFERAASVYERGRPSFPEAAVSHVVSALDLRPGRSVLDIGAGTGKFSRLLEPSGARILAIEPVASMRLVAREATPGVGVVGATAEALPLRTAGADAAVAAQAFHWFDGPAALAELARVLPAGAGLALVWNVRDESVGWVRAITDLIEPYRGDTPSHRSMRWLAAFDDQATWTLPASTSFMYQHRSTREATVDRVTSISFIAALDPRERAHVAAEVDGVLPLGDTITFPYRTDVWLSRRW